MQIGSYTSRFSMPLENRSQMTGSKTAGTDKAKNDFLSHLSSPDDIQTVP